MRRIGVVSLAVIFFSISPFLAGCGSAGPTASIETERGTLPAGPKKGEFDDAHPAVVLQTSLGEITVELNPVNAPIAVDNFLAYVARSKYDGTIFHQVVEGYMALGGGYDAELKARPAELPIRNEAHHGQKNLRGTIAMARSPESIDSATNQFFFNLADNANLDHTDRTPEGYGYCVFGKVTAGQEVLDQISSAAVTDQPDFPQIPATPITIKTIRRVR